MEKCILDMERAIEGTHLARAIEGTQKPVF